MIDGGFAEEQRTGPQTLFEECHSRFEAQKARSGYLQIGEGEHRAFMLAMPHDQDPSQVSLQTLEGGERWLPNQRVYYLVTPDDTIELVFDYQGAQEITQRDAKMLEEAAQMGRGKKGYVARPAHVVDRVGQLFQDERKFCEAIISRLQQGEVRPRFLGQVPRQIHIGPLADSSSDTYPAYEQIGLFKSPTNPNEDYLQVSPSCKYFPSESLGTGGQKVVYIRSKQAQIYLHGENPQAEQRFRETQDLSEQTARKEKDFFSRSVGLRQLRFDVFINARSLSKS